MDRTQLNLVSLLIGGAGLFTVLTGFNVPQLNMSFFGENPFGVKRDIIESTMNWTFVSLAILGLMIQLGAEIWASDLSDRSHGPKYYASFVGAGLVTIAFTVWLLTGFGNWIARLQWEPKVVALQREIFDRTTFVLEHDGWRPEHWENPSAVGGPADVARYRADSLRDASNAVEQMEVLLELKSKGDLRQRIAALQPFFAK